ncbi:MAG TPA: triose-phosphate isomerase [Candidatus Nanoarchaeia archaeon]|nr:triose-phosphate isomerase [Candidatus Nanoarchaeia archaeon]
MRKPIIIANWKMHKTSKETVKFLHELKKHIKDVEHVDVIICPPFTALFKADDELEAMKDEVKIRLGAQNMHFEDEGAFTGEISAVMLKEFCKFVILGHSERRYLFAEDNEMINRKVKAALEHNLSPILCVGETLEERNAKHTKEAIEYQLSNNLKGIKEDDVLKAVIAYEPVWAIGTGHNATHEEAEEVHSYIRFLIAKIYSEETAEKTRIVYGGSITPKTAKEFIEHENVDGFLVGSASLDAEDFARLVKWEEKW